MIAFAAITAVWTLGMLILGVSDALIYLAPALLILLPLLSGRYPGDEVLVRAALRGRRAAPAPAGCRAAPGSLVGCRASSAGWPAGRRGAGGPGPARARAVTRLTT